MMFAGRKIAVYADQRILLSFFYFHCRDLSIQEILSNKGSDLKQNSMRWYSNIELTIQPTSKSIHSKTINICKGRRGRDEMKLFSSRQPFRPSLHPQWMDVASCLLLPRWGGATCRVEEAPQKSHEEQEQKQEKLLELSQRVMRSFFHPSLHCRRRQEDEEEDEITAAAAVTRFAGRQAEAKN